MTQLPQRLVTLFALSVLCSGTATTLGQEGSGWYASFADAQQAANESGQPLLIHFHASWCGPCQRMNREVLHQPDVLQRLRVGLVAVEVDVSHHPNIAGQFGASTVPRDVVVFPDGSTETMHVGFMPKVAYVSLLASIADRGYQIAAAKQRELDQQQRRQQRTSDETAPQQPEAVVVQDDTAGSNDVGTHDQQESTSENDVLIGLEGFCPVRLHEKREWVKGKPDFTTTHYGVVYYFSGQAELQEFLNSKDKYAPQNLGCDTVVLLSEQQAVTGRIRYGAFFDGRLYLFSSPENRQEFKANPLRYTHVRHAIKVDQLIGQRFQ